MDKWFNSPWFIKVISFFIALMLYMMVNMDNVNNQPGVLPTITNGAYTLEEVDLQVYYNEDEFAVTDIAEHVQVNLRGPQNVLTLLQIARPAYEAYVDLRNLGVGTHIVKVQHRDFPNELSVSIVPQTVRVTIEQKQTISLPIEIDLINKSEVSKGYTIGTPIVNPLNVEITAAESIISQVAFAKGFIDVKGAKETVEKSVSVKVYDHQGNELNIRANPAVVDVKVPITSPNKDVPLKIDRKGELQDGLSIRSIVAEPKDVTIFGSNEVIQDISFIEGITVDLSTITENTVLEVEVPVPKGVEKVSPSIVKIIVEVDVEESIEFDNLAVDIIGLAERLEGTFITPEDGLVSLTVKGAPAVIERIKATDIRAYIDLNQLSIGEHTVPLQITGPQNVKYKTPIEEITIVISEINNSNSGINEITDDELEEEIS